MYTPYKRLLAFLGFIDLIVASLLVLFALGFPVEFSNFISKIVITWTSIKLF